MKNHLLRIPALVMTGLLAACVTEPVAPAPATPPAPAMAAAPAVPPPVDASAAIPKRANARFYELHSAFLKRGKEPMGVLFLGDSITEGWGKAPEVWKEHYEKDQPANFGIGGDQTQHVIWRIEDGELDGLKPKVVVLMIGTNNTGVHTGAQIAAADTKIVRLIREKIPGTKVLLLAIFPRGPRKNKDGVVTNEVVLDAQKRMTAIRAANVELAKLDDGKNVRYLDINAGFLDHEGKIPDTIMPDQLHPNVAGYKIWAEAMQPLLDEMLK